MGNLISQAADGIGDALGSAFAAPFKSVFSAKCEEVCTGPWDVFCFMEHLCIADLVKFLLIVVLCYIILLFFFLLFKLGICQCIGKSLCKMCWTACCTYWYAIGDIFCFFWRKLSSTKRVYRRRRRYQDIEFGNVSSSDEETDILSDRRHLSANKKRKLLRHSDGAEGSVYHSNHHGTRSHSHRQRHHVKLRGRQVSFRSRRLRSSRHHRRSRPRHHHSRNSGKSFKKQRIG